MKKVNVIEVKRAFLISNFLEVGKKRLYLGRISKEKFFTLFSKVRKGILKLKETELDKIINRVWDKRLKAYDAHDWYIGSIPTRQIGVWRRTGGLPLSWTNGSLEETAKIVKLAIKNNSKLLKNRPRRAITNMLQTNISNIQEEKYLYPILFEAGSGTKPRKRLRKQTKFAIDDGNMRSITLTISGAKKIKAYIGVPAKDRIKKAP